MEPHFKMNPTRRLVLLSLMVSQALILSILESLIPFPSIVPGVKPGLANIVTLISIRYFTLKDTLSIVIVRCILTAMLSGNPMIFLFSISGGLLSALAMTLLQRWFSKYFGMIGISIVGAILHNCGQLIAATLVIRDITAVWSYLPILLVSGIIMGIFVGLCSHFLSIAIERSGIFRRN